MNIEIIIGSVLGASEYVAEALDDMLKKHGHNTRCHFSPNADEVNFDNLLIIVTSTHGAGDLPDNIQGFADALQSIDLKGVNAIIIGLGDSSYDTFCEGSRTMETIITEAGGKVLFPVFQIDVLHHPIPEDIAVPWLEKQLENI